MTIRNKLFLFSYSYNRDLLQCGGRRSGNLLFDWRTNTKVSNKSRQYHKFRWHIESGLWICAVSSAQRSREYQSWTHIWSGSRDVELFLWVLKYESSQSQHGQLLGRETLVTLLQISCCEIRAVWGHSKNRTKLREIIHIFHLCTILLSSVIHVIGQ